MQICNLDVSKRKGIKEKLKKSNQKKVTKENFFSY